MRGRELATRSVRLLNANRALSLWLLCAGVLLLVAATGSRLATFDPGENFVGEVTAPPNPAHWMGTDTFGRDVFSRIVAGTRASLVVALLSTSCSVLVGSILGSLAAVAPSVARTMVARFLDIVVAFPAIILAVAVATVLRPGLGTTVAVLAFVFTPPVARVVRGAVLAELPKDYVAAAQISGARLPYLLWHHVRPNLIWQLLVFSGTLLATALLTEGGLSFLGLGIQPPTPSWGNIMNEGRVLIASGGWWVSTFGGMAIFLSTLVFVGLAESLARRKVRG